MNKADLVKAIADQSKLTQVDAEKALNAFVSVVTDSLKAGDSVILVGFGTFKTAKRAARIGVVPGTDKKREYPAKTVAKFSAGSKLAESVNEEAKKPVAKKADKAAPKKADKADKADKKTTKKK